jgi:hypothetical protein
MGLKNLLLQGLNWYISPSWRGTKGEDFSTSPTKARWDYASEWTRDPRRGGFKLIKAVLFTFF